MQHVCPFHLAALTAAVCCHSEASGADGEHELQPGCPPSKRGGRVIGLCLVRIDGGRSLLRYNAQGL